MTPLTRPTAAPVDDAFLALVLDDEELLDAEFEAIVAATWSPAPPVRKPGVPVPAPSDGPSDRWAWSERRAGWRGRAGSSGPGTDGWSRERSPPQ